jgi:hypothetical protein
VQDSQFVCSFLPVYTSSPQIFHSRDDSRAYISFQRLNVLHEIFL